MSSLHPVSRGDQFHISDVLQPEPLPTKARTLRVTPGNRRQPAPVPRKGSDGAGAASVRPQTRQLGSAGNPDGNPDHTPSSKDCQRPASPHPRQTQSVICSRFVPTCTYSAASAPRFLMRTWTSSR